MQSEGMTVSPDGPIQFNATRWDEIANRTRPGMGGYANEQEGLIWSALKQQTVRGPVQRNSASRGNRRPRRTGQCEHDFRHTSPRAGRGQHRPADHAQHHATDFGGKRAEYCAGWNRTGIQGRGRGGQDHQPGGLAGQSGRTNLLRRRPGHAGSRLQRQRPEHAVHQPHQSVLAMESGFRGFWTNEAGRDHHAG